MTPAPPRAGLLAARIALFALVGAPLLAVVWEALNQLLAGHAAARRLLPALVAAAALALLVRALARALAPGGPAPHP